MNLDNKKIIKRADNRWQASYFNYNHKRCYIYDRTQKGCYNKLKTALEELHRITARKAKAKKTIILDDWLSTWMKTYKEPNVKNTTARRMYGLIRRYIHLKLGSKSLKDMNQLEILNAISDIPGERSRQMVFVLLKDCFKTAVANELMNKNPLDNVPIPKHQKKEMRALSRTEESLFIVEARKSKDYEILMLQLYGGLRIGEVLALRGTDIKDNYFIVDESKSELKEITATKNHKSRHVPIFQELSFLNDKDKNSNELLYPGQTRSLVYNEFIKICKRVGISNVSMHGLRHTFATTCARKNITAKQVQLWLGHSDVSVTLKYYTNIDTEFELENIARKNK